MAGRIPQSFINDLLARVDIVQLIESCITLKKAGKDYQALCPFHNEKTPSFTVSPSKQMYYCFGCGMGGNAIGFLMEYERLDFVDAVEELASRYGLTIPYEQNQNKFQKNESKDLYEIMSQAAVFYQQQLRKPNAKLAIDYLKQRGLTGEIVKQFGVGYAPEGWDHLLNDIGKNAEIRQQLFTAGMLVQKENGFYDRFRDRIMFPIRDRRGRVIGFGGRVLSNEQPKYLNSPETPIFHKGTELYGLYEAKQENRNLNQLLVVEGYMDVVALAQYGITYAVATLGTATTAHHIESLFRVCPTIVFCFDGDRAGYDAAWRALEVIIPMLRDEWQPRFIFLPQGEDPDSLVRKEGKQKFEQRVEEAMPLSQYFFDAMAKDIDLSRAEGRSSLAKRTMQYIEKIPGDFAREQFIQHLAELVRMDAAKLNKFLPQKESSRSSLLSESTKIKLSPMRLVIMLLLQHPELVQQIDRELPDIQVEGFSILKELIDLLKKDPILSTGLILEYWRDREEYSIISRLAIMEHGVPKEGIAVEFRSVLDKLICDFKENKIEHLMAKAVKSEISDQEKRELQQLLIQSRGTRN